MIDLKKKALEWLDAHDEGWVNLAADQTKDAKAVVQFMREAVIAHSPAPVWNFDMSQAPRDGTEILVYCPYTGVVTAKHQGKKNAEWICTVNGGSMAVKYMSDFGTEYHDDLVPTHWMPLPLPPPPADEGEKV